MTILLTFIHIVVCFVLIMVVLLQSGKAADLAGAFGGGGSQTALGSRGAATLLTKATTGAAVLFMFTSLGLAILASRGSRSVLEGNPPAPIEAPATGLAPDFEEFAPPDGATGEAAGAEDKGAAAATPEGEAQGQDEPESE